MAETVDPRVFPVVVSQLKVWGDESFSEHFSLVEWRSFLQSWKWLLVEVPTLSARKQELFSLRRSTAIELLAAKLVCQRSWFVIGGKQKLPALGRLLWRASGNLDVDAVRFTLRWRLNLRNGFAFVAAPALPSPLTTSVARRRCWGRWLDLLWRIVSSFLQTGAIFLWSAITLPWGRGRLWRRSYQRTWLPRC